MYKCYVCDPIHPCTAETPDETMLIKHYCLVYGDEKEARFEEVV